MLDSPGVLPSLHFFRPSCFCELFPHDKTPPSLVTNKVWRSPQLMAVTAAGKDQVTGLRACCGPNCPLEPSPQQKSCIITWPRPEVKCWVNGVRLLWRFDAALKCCRKYHNHSNILVLRLRKRYRCRSVGVVLETQLHYMYPSFLRRKWMITANNKQTGCVASM